MHKRRDAQRPIGVFDSGVGGLTVLRALKRRLPGERLVYFGDSAHVPYGSKSREAVTAFSRTISRYLVGEGVKMVVVACNTASAMALQALRRELPVPVVGVIEPGARAAARLARKGRVGVIGTEGTVSSHAYREALRGIDPGVSVEETACPLFVPLVEEGWWKGRITRAVAERYLAPLRRRRLDALILGCTHYPLLKGVLRQIVGKDVVLVDSAEETALEVARILDREGLRRVGRRGMYRFIASDAPERFRVVARRLLGMAVPRVEVVRFD